MNWLRETADGVVLTVRVVPRASRNRVEGVLGEALKVRLQAPPVEGKANRALLKFLAGELGLSTSALRLVAGDTSRTKRLRVTGLGREEVVEKLGVEGG